MDDVRVGVVGAAGHMGKRFISILSSYQNVSLVAVADVNQEGLAALPAPPTTARYIEYREMFDKHPDLTAVIIATPDGLHRAPCLDALSRGFHVMVEKPLADTLSDAEAIVEAWRQTDRLLFVGHTLRFDSRYIQAYEAVKAGEIGEIVFMAARRNDFLRSPYRIAGRTSPIFFLGVHDLDMFQWFAGERASGVTAVKVSKRLKDLGVEDAVIVRAEFASGIQATLEAAWILPESIGKSDHQLEVIGTKGALFIDAYHTGLRIHSDTGWRQPDALGVFSFDGTLYGMFRIEMDHFLNCIGGRTKLVVTPDDALAAVRLAIFALRSADLNGQLLTL
jgi:predicted dehydrogenase